MRKFCYLILLCIAGLPAYADKADDAAALAEKTKAIAALQQEMKTLNASDKSEAEQNLAALEQSLKDDRADFGKKYNPLNFSCLRNGDVFANSGTLEEAEAICEKFKAKDPDATYAVRDNR